MTNPPAPRYGSTPSHPSRGAWIEMCTPARTRPALSASHPSRGAWIEIRSAATPTGHRPGRTPHGVRGLKYHPKAHEESPGMSHPSRGAWIEIYTVTLSCSHCRSHPSRGAWIEIRPAEACAAGQQSHPSRGAWIEIRTSCPQSTSCRSRTPHGVRGLKLLLLLARREGAIGRTPHGVRGLKSRKPGHRRHHRRVAPLTGCVD